MQVPFLDLKAQYTALKDEILSEVADVLESQQCIGGPKVARFEEKIAALSGCSFAVGVSSGTDALLNSLMSLDISSGDEVITSPFSFIATGGSIARTGATPVFVDIDPRTYNIHPGLIEEAITERTKAILPVHLFGQTADMDPILQIARRYNLAVVEDAAQSITATYEGRKAGSMGTTGCFSFFPSKNLGGAGDGGMVVTGDEELYSRLKAMRNHGSQRRGFHKYLGANFRLDAVQAAVLLVKTPYLNEWSEARRRNAAFYDSELSGAPVRTPYVRPECLSIYNQYVIRAPKRDELFAYLKENGVGCQIYYHLPMHLQECFRYLGYERGRLPEAEKAANEVLALPVYPELEDAQKHYVAGKIKEFYEV